MNMLKTGSPSDVKETTSSKLRKMTDMTNCTFDTNMDDLELHSRSQVYEKAGTCAITPL